MKKSVKTKANRGTDENASASSAMNLTFSEDFLQRVELIIVLIKSNMKKTLSYTYNLGTYKAD